MAYRNNYRKLIKARVLTIAKLTDHMGITDRNGNKLEFSTQIWAPGSRTLFKVYANGRDIASGYGSECYAAINAYADALWMAYDSLSKQGKIEKIDWDKYNNEEILKGLN